MLHHIIAVWVYRHFWLSLVRADLRQRYRRSVLGLGWSLLQPLAMTATFCLVFSSILGNADWKHYAPYLLGGMCVWEFIRNSLTTGCTTFIRNEAYIRQCPLPVSIYPLRTVLGVAIHFLISLFVVVTLVSLLNWETGPIRVLWAVIPSVLMVIVFAWSVSTLAAFANVYFHDTQHIVDVGAQLWFFITPIIYMRSHLDNKQMGWVADLNPVYTYISLIRDPLVFDGHPIPTAEAYAHGASLTLVTFGLACGAIAWLHRKLIFQL